MARASLRLLDEPGLALRLSRAARVACLERFTWPAVQEAWVRVYRELAAANRRMGHAPA
jgi:glycosyltransferase involved in cell wall biosynthesis